MNFSTFLSSPTRLFLPHITFYDCASLIFTFQFQFIFEHSITVLDFSQNVRVCMQPFCMLYV